MWRGPLAMGFRHVNDQLSKIEFSALGQKDHFSVNEAQEWHTAHLITQYVLAYGMISAFV
jgi:hypothetical protein